MRIVSFLISFWFFALKEGAFNFYTKEKPRLNLRLLFNTLNVELARFYLYLKLLLKLTILNKRDYILDDCFESSLSGIVVLESIARLWRSAELLWFSTIRNLTEKSLFCQLDLRRRSLPLSLSTSSFWTIFSFPGFFVNSLFRRFCAQDINDSK